MVGRLSTSAMPKRCFLVVLRLLQRPPPAHIRPYPRRRKTTPRIQVPPIYMRVFKNYQALKRSNGLTYREIMTLVHM
jgi:hypothetical protein